MPYIVITGSRKKITYVGEFTKAQWEKQNLSSLRGGVDFLQEGRGGCRGGVCDQETCPSEHRGESVARFENPLTSLADRETYQGTIGGKIAEAKIKF